MCHRASPQYETVSDGCDIVFKVLLDGDRSLLTPEHSSLGWPTHERLDGGLALYRRIAASHRNVLRPVHYLGNKQRSLSAILPHVAATVGPGDTVADLFTGTSVVAQSMASLNLNIVALDVSPACATMARATLGIGRGKNDDPEEIFETVAKLAQRHLQELSSVFCRWLDAEDQAVAVADGGELLSLGGAIPQVWRHQPDDRLGALFDRWRSATRTGDSTPALLSPVYAGTYLGVRQAVTLDAYRAAVGESMRQCFLTPWQAQAMITSLLSAASSAAFTAGKHFAQPYKLGPRTNSGFHRSRILADRSVNILAHATRFLSHLVARARPATECHEVIEAPVENLTVAALVSRGVRLVYADPPYTAQQYSRFYHLLDTYATGRPRPLQTVRGEITSGLYPTLRYMSSFCRKTQAMSALRSLVEVCRAADTTLLLSYSLSARTSVGNKRILNLQELTDVLADSYGRSALSLVELDHRYRQFNQESSVSASRADKEILVVALAA